MDSNLSLLLIALLILTYAVAFASEPGPRSRYGRAAFDATVLLVLILLLLGKP
jgi:hypothetical protein